MQGIRQPSVARMNEAKSGKSNRLASGAFCLRSRLEQLSAPSTTATRPAGNTKLDSPTAESSADRRPAKYTKREETIITMAAVIIIIWDAFGLLTKLFGKLLTAGANHSSFQTLPYFSILWRSDPGAPAFTSLLVYIQERRVSQRLLKRLGTANKNSLPNRLFVYVTSIARLLKPLKLAGLG